MVDLQREWSGMVERPTLRQQGRFPAWFAVAWRAAAVLLVLSTLVLFFWIFRDELVDELDGHVSFTDVIYFMMISATTTGYGDIVPVTDRTRLFAALILTPAQIFLILIFLGSAYQLVVQHSWERWIMARIQRRLRGHTIVVGSGTSGTQANLELIRRGIPPQGIVIIDPDPDELERAQELGCNVIQADGTQERALRAARIDTAKSLVVSAGRDDTSILACLTARNLAPEIPITVLVREEDNEILARQAGADTVVNPKSFAGLLLAGSSAGDHTVAYIDELATHDGLDQISQRPVEPHELGKPLTEIATGLGVRIYRDGNAYGFWESEAGALEQSDIIIEILPPPGNRR
jgi:voltage-gated potassium channel